MTSSPSPAQPSSSSSAASFDVAVVGMALHVPGARTPRAYWKNVREGVESVRELTDEELLAAGVSREALAQPNYVRRAAILEGLAEFDAGFFGFSPKDAAITDPQHRRFLECCWEALEDAGHPPETFRGPIGVFGGSGMAAYMAFNVLGNRELVDSVGLFLLRHTGNDKDFLTTRVSYCLDLHGPSVNVQTACSTSLVAIHLACQSLLSGECDMALAGGVTVTLPHGRGYLYHENEILAPDGVCRPFDARSGGTVFSSGAGVVVLRRLDDALADGDHVYAVIKGSAINNDGARKVGYLAPSVDGQARAIAEALAVAGVEPRSIGYVEAHGTATAVGDPIEVAALTQAFRSGSGTRESGFCGLGSVKGNIGHADTAAGVASFIKVALALKHRELPPSLHFEKPNPEIDFASTPFYVNAKLTPWKSSGEPRRAGVSSLGVGGTNAHVVLEEAPQAQSTRSARPWQLLVLSARSRSALDAATANLAAHLATDEGVELADVAWTLQAGRRAFAWRRSLVVRDLADARAALANPAEATPNGRQRTNDAGTQRSTLVFMLPGGGAQHPRMARDLYLEGGVFRREVERALALLEPNLARAVRRAIDTPDAELELGAQELERPSIQLPALFVIEHALAQHWIALGLEPAALIGHSMGENTAACLAGVLSLQDALGLVALRGRLFERVEPGGMLAVQLSAAELVALLPSGVGLAVSNAPALSVASGTREGIAELERVLASRGVDHSRIHIQIAAHSALLEPILEEFRAYLKRIQLSAPRIPIVSNLTGTWLTNEQAVDPEYWVSHLRRTVQFSDGIRTLLQDPARVLLEVGPGQTLCSLARAHGNATLAPRVVASMRRRDESLDDRAFALDALGRLWIAGLKPSWDALRGDEQRLRVPLPTYPFERQRYWIEPTSRSAATQEHAGGLARVADMSRWFHVPRWRREVLSNAPSARESRWLVFADERGDGGGFADALVARLRSEGASVIVARAAERFERIDDEQYTLSAQDAEGYVALLEDLRARQKLPERIVHCWMVTHSEATEVTTTFFHWVQEHGFYSLLFLAQALGAVERGAPLHLTVVGNGMQALEGEVLAHPAKAAVLGPCLVAPRELDHLSASCVDVDVPVEARARRGRSEIDARAVDLVAREACAAQSGAIVAVRAGERFVQRHEPLPLPARGDAPPVIRERGVYLITGGLGGIGLSIAAHLARTAHARLALLARSALPPRERWDELLARRGASGGSHAVTRRIRDVLELEKLGAEVEVLAADVANVEELRQALARVRERFGALHGVVHAAGTIDDGLLQTRTPAAVDRVFTPKVHGTLLLDAELGDAPLDFFVVCSSTSAQLGPAGQIDYAAANAFLDAFAEQRAARRAGVSIAIEWGVWQEVGMAARLSGRAGASASTEVARELGHALLGERIHESDDEIQFQTKLSPRTHWVLDQHRLADGTAVVPGTGFLEIARAAVESASGASACELRDVSFVAPLAVPDDGGRNVRTRLRRDENGFTFQIASCDDAADPSGSERRWVLHAQGRALALDGTAPQRPQLNGLLDALGRAELASEKAGPQMAHLRFGERWRVLERAVFAHGEALALLELPESFRAEVADYALHPALLDLATGFALPLARAEGSQAFYAPIAYGSVRVHKPLTARVLSHVRLAPSASHGEIASFDVAISDESGALLVEVEGFTVRRLERALDVAAPSSRRADAQSADARPSPLQKLVANGIKPAEGVEAFERVLAARPGPRIVVSSIDLSALRAELDAEAHDVASSAPQFARPELSSSFVAPRDEIERKLAAMWQELLGIERVGIHDNFFDLGGYSLVAVRLFSQVRRAWKLEFPLATLFEAPTIELLAARIRGELGTDEKAPEQASARRLPFLVPLHPGKRGARRPFFLVAGMYGNVMNLRHLAGHLGADQPLYGIQARGLDGKEEPHSSFEQMAADYLADVRALQPEGPYLLGGYSGGGITAYEMARQLRAAGEEVALLVFLDTPTPTEPPLTYKKRMALMRQRITKQGLGFFTDALRRKLEQKRREIRLLVNKPMTRLRPFAYVTERIESAFYAALAKYELKAYDGDVTLFRPELDESYVLAPDHVVNRAGGWVDPNNGWKPWVKRVHVHVVPGDHDNMVLEPHVRVLAARLREQLERAQFEADLARSKPAASERAVAPIKPIA